MDNVDNFRIKIYPNPSRNTIHASFPGRANVTLVLSDLSDKVIHQVSNLTDSFSYQDFRFLDKGIYVLQLLTDDVFHAKLVIKE